MATKPDITRFHIGYLDGTNWSVWKYKITMLMKGIPKALELLDGTYTIPIQKTDVSNTAFATAKEQFLELDSTILVILTSNMRDDIVQRIMRFDSSKDVWDELKRLFDGDGDDLVYEYCLKFFEYKKEPEDNMAIHLSKLKNIWFKLNKEITKLEGNHELPEIVLLCKILDTLPDEYLTFKSSWLLMAKKERTIDRLTSQLCAFERNVELQPSTSGESNQALAVKAFKKGKKAYKDNMKCNYCGQPGHKVRKCAKWLNDGRPPKPSTGVNSNNVNVTDLMMADSDRCLYPDKDNWYIDSGATSHVTFRRDLFHTFESFDSQHTVTTANGEKVEATGKGDIKLEAIVGDHKNVITLCDVWCVPSLQKNLFSLLAAQDRLPQSFFESEPEFCRLKSRGIVKVTGQRKRRGGLFKLDVKNVMPPVPVEVNALSSNSLQIYHERLAHQSKLHVRKVMERELGIKMVNNTGDFCEGCSFGKMHRKPFGTRERANRPGEILNSDVCGPFPLSYKGYRYFLLFKDDFSKFRYVYFMKQKSEVYSKLQLMLEETKVAGHIVKELLSDNGGEFDNQKTRTLLQRNGIKHRLIMPYTPQQNGCSERENRTLVEAARAMMYAHEELPVACWAELISTAAYVLNRTGPTPVEGKSPYELWFNKKPKIKHLRIIGSLCYVHVPKQKRKKLDKKSEKCILIGYDGDDGYRLLNMSKDKHTLVRSRDVVFQELAITRTDTNVNVRSNPVERSEMEITLRRLPNLVVREEASQPIHDLSEENSQPIHDVREEDYESPDTFQECIPSESFENTPEGNIHELPIETQDEVDDVDDQTIPERLEVTNEDETLQDSEIENQGRITLRDRSTLRPPAKFNDYVMNAVDDMSDMCEPTTYSEVLNSQNKEHWIKAMKSEMKSLDESKTWTLVDLPKGRKAISCKWIFKLKTNADGTIDKYKARLVARGYSQKPGVDYDETFSPVAKMTTIRSIISVAANEGLSLTQFDVSTAFLNGTLQEEIFMKQPEGMSDGSNRVCKLKRSLYGLKQAPRCWNKCIVDYLKSIGFEQSQTDPCLFTRKRVQSKLILVLYVDDGLVAATNQKDADKFMVELKRRFKITMKPADYYLGLELHRNDDGSISINQKHYTEKVLARFGMSNCRTVTTPIIKDSEQGKSEEGIDEKSYPYRQAVGALAYLMVGTRPDIAFAVGVVSRTLENPSREDVLKVKRIMRYLQGTLSYGITYKKDYESGILEAYSDSDHAGDIKDRRSTSGILCLYAGGAISWASRKQSSVAISSTEAEIVAASETAREVVWLKRLFNDITALKEIPILKIDNDAAVKIAQNPDLHRRTKHIAVRHFYVRELVADGKLKVKHVGANLQSADLLTKPLSKPSILAILDRIGLQCT